MLEKYEDKLSKFYTWTLVGDYCLNPLFKATEQVETQLERCPDRRTNQNQVVPLEEVSPYIFYELKRRATPMTPTKSKRQAPATVTPKKSKKLALRHEFESTTSEALL